MIVFMLGQKGDWPLVVVAFGLLVIDVVYKYTPPHLLAVFCLNFDSIFPLAMVKVVNLVLV